MADDFLYQGLNIPGNTANLVGSNVTITNVDVLPGQNTLGISLVRIDYAPYGQNPPHIHPRASEILTVLEGTLLVGFVTSNLKTASLAKSSTKGMFLCSLSVSFTSNSTLGTLMQ